MQYQSFLCYLGHIGLVLYLNVTRLAEREREIMWREKETCLGQIVVRCAGFESGEVVEFGKVPRPEGFWPLHYLFRYCADIFKQMLSL